MSRRLRMSFTGHGSEERNEQYQHCHDKQGPVQRHRVRESPDQRRAQRKPP